MEPEGVTYKSEVVAGIEAIWALPVGADASKVILYTHGGGFAVGEASVDQPRWANRGRWNFGLQVGYGVENAIPRNISHVNMLILQPQVGLIVKDFRSGPLRQIPLQFGIMILGLLAPYSLAMITMPRSELNCTAMMPSG